MKLPRKLSQKAMREVARRARSGENRRALAGEYGISLSYVHMLASGALPRGGQNGRPVGSGATSIRILVRASTDDGNGHFTGAVRIFIGRALWQVIGSPDAVDFDGIPGDRYWIQPGSEFRVTGPRTGGQPRFSLSVGKTAMYDLRPGTYPASVDGGSISFAITAS